MLVLLVFTNLLLNDWMQIAPTKEETLLFIIKWGINIVFFVLVFRLLFAVAKTPVLRRAKENNQINQMIYDIRNKDNLNSLLDQIVTKYKINE